MSAPNRGAVSLWAVARGVLYSSAPANATLLPSGGGGGPTPSAPVNLVPPSMSGTAEVGESLTWNPGSWSGYPSPSVSRQWTADGVDIPGETSLTLVLDPSLEGAVIDGYENATNTEGTTGPISSSNSLGPVTAPEVLAAPTNTAPPSIMGTPEVGQQLMYMAGTWDGNPTPTVDWQWTADGADIVGETGTFLTLDAGHEGAVISGYEDASNSEGTASEPSSNSLGPVTAAATSLSSTNATQTSLPTTAPFTFTVDMGSDIAEGYYLDVQRTTLGSGDYSTTTLDISYQLTPQNHTTRTVTASDLASAGYAAPPSNITFWERTRWRREDGVTGPWTELTDTINASTAKWAANDGPDRHANLTTSTDGLTMTMESTPGAAANVRATQPALPGKRYFEAVLTNGVNSNGTLALSVLDGASSLSGYLNVGQSTPGFGFRIVEGSTGYSRRYNGASQPGSNLNVAAADGDMFGVEFDQDGLTAHLWHKPVSTGVWYQAAGSITMTSNTPAAGDWYASSGAYAGGTEWTTNFGALPFDRTPTTGYEMYG